MKQSKMSTLVLGVFILLIMQLPAWTQHDSQNCTLIGRWAKGPCRTIEVVDKIAYFGNGGYLEIVDFTHPENQVELSRILMPSYIGGIAVKDNYAFVVTVYAGLRIIDITNPSQAAKIGFLEIESTIWGVAVSGSYIYAANSGYGLRIIDISDPAHSSGVAFFNMAGFTYDVVVKYNYAYLAAGSNGFRVYDISDIANRIEVAFWKTENTTWGIELAAHYVYLADHAGGLRIFDVANPSKPVQVGNYRTGANIYCAKPDGDYIYLANGNDGLYVLEFEAPVAVKENDQADLPQQHRLLQNFPSTFNPSTRISYNLQKSMQMKLKIYNIQGQEIKTLINEFQTVGIKSVVWDGLDDLTKSDIRSLYLPD